MLLKSRASPDMLPLNLCNKRRLAIRHMNRPLFPTTLSIPSYDMGKYPLVYSTLKSFWRFRIQYTVYWKVALYNLYCSLMVG